MITDIKKALINHKSATYRLMSLSDKQKSVVLLDYAKMLKRESNNILSENQKDIVYAKRQGRDEAFLDRLTLSESKVLSMASQVKHIAHLKDPVGRLISEKKIMNGMILQKVVVPLGSICIIYESRPDVTVNATALCFRSSNGVILRGGSESLNSNRILIAIFHQVLKKHQILESCALFIDSQDRKIVNYLLRQDQYIDVVIPRGGYELVRMVNKISRIPVLSHSEGGARIYIDKSADIKKAVAICINAKTNRPATCNSLDCIILHKDIASKVVPSLFEKMHQKGVTIIGDSETRKLATVHPAKEADWGKEFLSLKVMVKIVADSNEALLFIQKHTKHHSEGIVAHDQKVINTFVAAIDAAALFINCSTRLHDGSIFDMGAEMGIATGKLHARGPVGLEELTTMKWILKGSGQVRSDS